MKILLKIASFLLLLVTCSGQTYSQCSNYGSYDNSVCNETVRTYTCLMPCASGHCRYGFTGSPINATFVSQTPNSVTYRIGRGAPSYTIVWVSIWDSVLNCGAFMDWTDRYADFSYPDISGTIPPCPNTSQVYSYIARRRAYSNGFYPTESLSWTIQGGTIQSIASSANLSGYVYDTAMVMWNANGPHEIRCSRYGSYNGGSFSGICYNYDTLRDGTGSAPIISGPSVLCGTTTGTYSLSNFDPGFSHLWTCSNGTITSGQGTGTVTVNWAGNGTLSMTRTATPCGWTTSASLSVSLSGSAPPVPNLGPNLNPCTNAQAVLNPGNFTTYQWSNMMSTPTIAPQASGTYSVTVTNAAGCAAADTVMVTFGGNITTPNIGPYNQNSCGAALNPGSYASYLWNTGATTPTLTPSSSGTYSVTVSNGTCYASAVTHLTLNQPPSIAILSIPGMACQGTPVQLVATGNWASYLWSTGATSPTITVTNAGNYGLTVTDNNACTGSATFQLTYLPAPSFSLGNDSIICADTTIQLDGPMGAVAYNWSTGPTTSSIVVGSGGAYSLTVTDANGCTASDDIVITGLTDCVFPGDANYDNVADNLDILTIGAYYGTANAPRPGASTQWYGQSLPDWGGALPGQADPKHSDCDGDGVVTAADTTVVHLNYGRTHSKTGATAGTTADLRVVALQDSLAPGGIARFALQLGDLQNPVDSVYGLAFQIHYSTSAVAAPGLLNVDFSNCWFAPAMHRISFLQNFAPSAVADVAVVRDDQIDQVGQGEVCRFSILTDSNLSQASTQLSAWVSDVYLIDADLRQHPVTASGDSTVVTDAFMNSAATDTRPPIRIFPNPANDFVRIDFIHSLPYSTKIMDAAGRDLLTFTNLRGQSVVLPTDRLAEGLYFLVVNTSNGSYTQKLMIRR